MDARQIVRYYALQKVLALLARNSTALSANAQYVILKGFLDGKVVLLEAARIKQGEQVKPITETKGETRTLLIDTILPFMNKACVQAYNLGESVLAKSLDHPDTYLSSTTDEELEVRAKNIKKIIADNILIVTDILPANVTTMQTVITQFVAIRFRPVEEIKSKKSLGTDPIQGLLDDIFVILAKIGKIIKSSFSELLTEWKKNIKVGKPEGTRKLSLIISYTDTNDAILSKIKTIVTRGDTEHIKTSSKKGTSRFLSLTSGSYTITSKHPLFITDIKNNVVIKENSVVRLKIVMQSNAHKGTIEITAYNKEDGSVLVNVNVAIPKLECLGKTDENGKFTKNFVPDGTYEGSLTLENFQKVDFVVTVVGGETIALEFFMERV